MPAFKIPTELKLSILTDLVIESLIITIIKVYISIYTRSLIRGLIGRKHSYNLYYKAAHLK